MESQMKPIPGERAASFAQGLLLHLVGSVLLLLLAELKEHSLIQYMMGLDLKFLKLIQMIKTKPALWQPAPQLEGVAQSSWEEVPEERLLSPIYFVIELLKVRAQGLQ